MQIYVFIILAFVLTHLDGIWRLTKRFWKFFLVPPVVAVLLLTQDCPSPTYARELPRLMRSGMEVDEQNRKEKSIAQMYAPVLEFHPAECFFPMDAQEFLNLSSLVRRGFIQIEGWNKEGSFLYAHANPEYSLSLTTRKLSQEYCADFQNLAAKPVVYARISKDAGSVFVQYWFFYYYNDILARSVGSVTDWARGFTRLVPDFNHQGDWELIQLIFPKHVTVAQIARDGSSFRPLWVAYSQHGQSQRMDYSGQAHLEGLRPRVSVARGSHASSFEPVSCAIQLIEFPSILQGFDRRASLTEFPGEKYELKYVTEHDWYTFPGSWGSISLLGQGAWTHPYNWAQGGSDAHCLGGGERIKIPEKLLSEPGKRLVPASVDQP